MRNIDKVTRWQGDKVIDGSGFFTLSPPHLVTVSPKVRYLSMLAALIACCAITVGCADNFDKPTTRAMTTQERQDAALRDPFGYGPNANGTQMMENPNISGGGIGDFDKKAFDRDLDHVFNP